MLITAPVSTSPAEPVCRITVVTDGRAGKDFMMQISDVYEQLGKFPVESYGQQCALSDIAELTIHENTVYVKPYDPTQAGYLEKKIMKSGLGLNLSNDGRGLRVSIP
jgi:hypothetical protein